MSEEYYLFDKNKIIKCTIKDISSKYEDECVIDINGDIKTVEEYLLGESEEEAILFYFHHVFSGNLDANIKAVFAWINNPENRKYNLSPQKMWDVLIWNEKEKINYQEVNLKLSKEKLAALPILIENYK